MKKTQSDIIFDKLLKDHYITRNWCLERYISRLAPRILELKEIFKDMGYKIVGSRIKTKQGINYMYELIDGEI